MAEGDDDDVTVQQDVDIAALEAWGYMDGHAYFNLGALVVDKKRIETPGPAQNDALVAAMQVLSPRSLTDVLLQAFIDDDPYFSGFLFTPTLLEEYANWWRGRMTGDAPPVTFTCLLLRVCAAATQSPRPSLMDKLRFELAESAASLTTRFNTAAENLSGTLGPRRHDLFNVLQYLLGAAWLKSEARVVDAWHSVSAAIREAQEIGLHLGSNGPAMPALEAEMRTRIWCFIFLWDWQMSEWLSRPLIVNTSDNPFRTPNLDLEVLGEDSISPFATLYAQYTLVHRLSSRFGRLGRPSFPMNDVEDVIQTIDQWELELPRPLRKIAPDLSLDEKDARIPGNRALLHSFGWMVRMTPLKRLLVATPNRTMPEETRKFRAIAVDGCINCIASCGVLLDRLLVVSRKFHFSIFSIFDTATVICSALLHDIKRTLPQRQALLEAVGSAIVMLQRVAPITPVAAKSLGLLSSLVYKLPLSPHELAWARGGTQEGGAGASKRTKTIGADGSSATSSQSAPFTTSTPTHNTVGTGPAAVTDASASSFHSSGEISSNLDAVLHADFDGKPGQIEQVDPFDSTVGHLGDVDLGGMEELWDWEALNLGTLMEQDGVLRGGGGDNSQHGRRPPI